MIPTRVTKDGKDEKHIGRQKNEEKMKGKVKMCKPQTCSMHCGIYIFYETVTDSGKLPVAEIRKNHFWELTFWA